MSSVSAPTRDRRVDLNRLLGGGRIHFLVLVAFLALGTGHFLDRGYLIVRDFVDGTVTLLVSAPPGASSLDPPPPSGDSAEVSQVFLAVDHESVSDAGVFLLVSGQLVWLVAGLAVVAVLGIVGWRWLRGALLLPRPRPLLVMVGIVGTLATYAAVACTEGGQLVLDDLGYPSTGAPSDIGYEIVRYGRYSWLTGAIGLGAIFLATRYWSTYVRLSRETEGLV